MDETKIEELQARKYYVLQYLLVAALVLLFIFDAVLDCVTKGSTDDQI